MAQEGAAGCGSSKLDTPAAIRHIAALLDDIAAALLKGQKKSLIALPVLRQKPVVAASGYFFNRGQSRSNSVMV
jgi:hypothetical protein